MRTGHVGTAGGRPDRLKERREATYNDKRGRTRGAVTSDQQEDPADG